MPSIEKSEAFGVVQLEAMLYSLPIVSTKIPGSGVDWVNADGVSGITVEPKMNMQSQRQSINYYQMILYDIALARMLTIDF